MIKTVKFIKRISFFTSLALLLILSACNSSNKFAVFSGEIKSFSASELLLISNTDTIRLAVENGKFSDTIQQLDCYFYLQVNDIEVPVYFENGDNISLSVNPENGYEGFVFNGDGSLRMNYLLLKVMNLSTNNIDFSSLYSKNEKDFKEETNKVIDNIRKELELLKASKQFKKNEVNAIYYSHYNLLRSYPTYHPYVTNKTNFSISDDFYPKEFTDFDLSNAKDYAIHREYRELLLAMEMEKFYKSIEKNYPNLDASDLAFLDQIKIEQLKNTMVEQAAFFLSTANKDMDGFYSKLLQASTDKIYSKELTARYEKLKKILPGMTAPNFRYETVDGDFITSEELRGKYVYIDIWATWCGPCKQEIPALIQLQEDLKNENICFVSISVDQIRDKNTWKNMVKSENLGGYQLFADNSFHSFFTREFAVESIPRFILIDPNGIIVNSDAPRPSAIGTKIYLENSINKLNL
jgi:thiol-disulfide isomerase/thioredoxin